MGELETDDGVLDEFLAEGSTLVGVFYGFFVADSREAKALDDNAYAFVVEVGHDDFVLLLAFVEGKGIKEEGMVPLNP